MADPSAFDMFQRPDAPETAGSAFEPVTWRQQLQNYKQLEGQDAAWRSAEGSPWKLKEPGWFGKMIGDGLSSEPGQRLTTGSSPIRATTGRRRWRGSAISLSPSLPPSQPELLAPSIPRSEPCPALS